MPSPAINLSRGRRYTSFVVLGSQSELSASSMAKRWETASRSVPRTSAGYPPGAMNSETTETEVVPHASRCDHAARNAFCASP